MIGNVLLANRINRYRNYLSMAVVLHQAPLNQASSKAHGCQLLRMH